MAAEAVVTFFLEKLSTFITQEAKLLLGGVDEEIRELQRELEWMRLFIRQADAKRRAEPEVQLMVKQIREITFKAEDVIDEFILKIRRIQNNHFDCWFTRSIKCCTRQLPLLHELGNQIKVINIMSEKISINKSKYCIETTGESSRSTGDIISSLRKLKRPPIAEEWEVVVIEDSVKQVKSLLMGSGGGDDDRQRRIVISIVGMGGLGKTTLAKKLYNNADVKGHFDCFSWISVSQEYRLKDLLQGIIKCFKMHSKEELEELDEEETRKKLRDYLQGGKLKYLIVLDDIWDSNAWDGLNSAFPDQMNGSRILLTTRNRDVAEYADSSSNNIHSLRFLNEEESSKLFFNRIFAHALGGQRDNAQAKSMCPLELKQVGKEMIEKCGGLPLAIVVLGGLLSSRVKTYIEWSKVNANLNWQLTHGAGSKSCSGILALSYYDLPYYLKPCFLYICVYPEDHEITASKLILCWIAEGFVQRRGEETVEEVAEDYLEELIHRCMIQVGNWRYDGRVKSCRVHDLLRDLAIAEAKKDQFFQVYARIDEFSTKSDNYIRRLGIHGFHPEEQRYFSDQFRYTRSLMCFEINLSQIYRFINGCFKLLKVLDLESAYFEGRRLPKAIGELIHLKYLSVVPKYDLLESTIIPNSVIKLVNLQTLYLPCCKVECIPSEFWMSLGQLRHLKLWKFDPTILDRCCWSSIKSSNCDLNNLTDLQTLCIDSWDGINCGSLGKLMMLKKLRIRGSCNNEILDSVSKLTSLRSLNLTMFEDDGFAEIQISHLNYLTKLHLRGNLPSYSTAGNLFPPALVKLTLRYSEIETEGMVHRDLARLPNLKFLLLYINAYKGKKMVFPTGGFLRLQFLRLLRLEEVEELIVEEGALISLTHLEIIECSIMKMLPDGLRQQTTLEELKVHIMPKNFLDRLSENDGEDWEKIKHIPSVMKNSWT